MTVVYPHILAKPRFYYDPDEESLKYRNMLAVCGGGSDSGNPELSTCDKSRPDNIPLTVNPLDSRSISKVRFSSDGMVFSDDAATNLDLRKHLNLNSEDYSLPQNRKAALDALNASVERYRRTTRAKHGKMKSYCQRQRDDLASRAKRGEQLPEYAGILIWGLDRLIRRYS